MGVRIRNLRGHTDAWEFVSPTPRAKRKLGGLYSEPKGIPNLRGQTEAWESVSPIEGAILKCGSLYDQL